VLVVDERVIGPEPLAKFFACHDLSGLLEEHREDLERLAGQPQLQAALPQFPGADVDLEGTELD
jgi:hypothetical protein